MSIRFVLASLLAPPTASRYLGPTILRSAVPLLLSLGSAQAAPDLYGQFWGDALPLPPAAQQREQLDRDRLWVCPVVTGADVQAALNPAVQTLQETIAGMAKDDPARAALQQTLNQLKASGQSVPSPAAPRPSAAPLTLTQALKNTRTWLGQHEAAGVRGLAASPEGKSAGRASAFALQATLAGRPEAALAGLLTAHTLDPKNADTLVNLAGALVTVNLPAEALAVLAQAERQGIAPGGAMGISVQAVALNNRGGALVKLGRFAEADKVLRQALALQPTLTEAGQLLAHALLCQGKTADAVQVMRRSARRTPGTGAGQELPTSSGPGPSASQPTPASAGQVESRRPARQVFDMTRGQSITLPDLKIAQTPAQAVQLLDRYVALDEELSERGLALVRRQEAVEQQLRNRGEALPATQARQKAIWSALIASRAEPELRALDTRQDRTGDEVARIWGDFWHCEGGCSIAVIIDKAHGDEEVFRGLCVPQLQGAHERWRSAMHAYAHDLAAAAKADYLYETALAANYSDPLWHQRAALQAEIEATGRFGALVNAARLWAHDVKSFESGCVEGSSGAADSVPVAVPLKLPPPDVCKPLVGLFTTSVSLGVVDAGFSCDKVSLKVAPSGLLTSFVKAELDMSAEKWKTTVIIGLQGGGSLKEVAGLGVKAAVGAYVSATRDGIKDYGMVGEVKSSIGINVGEKLPIGQVKIGESAKAINARWSFVTGETIFDVGH
ncbi:tetratricopeptide repeat protein [Deinococcus sp. HMF7620]|uniref:Tetratricopeptide repeat protein n=1 Tax=Deinococcus arboris TaxID=2682977 RepID=A0A7C9HRS5_9DEIO|nr:tetratricopeptide repeat protein [Deinococcus arboris]MVN87093.1 tetratricopeptide repeat protein [Deinococcus arboris]